MKGEGGVPKDAPKRSISSFLIRGGSITLVARLVAVASGFGTQLVLARLFDPSILGTYFLTQSVVITTADIAQVGLPRVIVRELAKATGAREAGFGAALLKRALMIALVSIGIVGLAYATFFGRFLAVSVFEASAMTHTAKVTGLWIMGLAIQNIVSESLRGTHAVGWASILGGSLASFSTCTLLAFAFFADVDLRLEHALLLAAIGTLVSAFIGALLLRKRVDLSAATAPPPYGFIFKSATGLLGIGISTSIIAQSDIWILGALQSEEDVALYGAARRLILLVTLPGMIASLVVPPLISDLYAKGKKEQLQRVLRGTASVAGLPSLILLCGFLAFSEPILGVTFGDYYRPAATVLAILSIERMFYVIAGSCGMLLMMTGYDRLMLRVVLAAGVAQVICVYFGSQYAGIEGAAIGMLGGSAFRSILLWNAARRATGIRTDISPSLALEGFRLVSSRLRSQGQNGSPNR